MSSTSTGRVLSAWSLPEPPLQFPGYGPEHVRARMATTSVQRGNGIVACFCGGTWSVVLNEIFLFNVHFLASKDLDSLGLNPGTDGFTSPLRDAVITPSLTGVR